MSNEAEPESTSPAKEQFQHAAAEKRDMAGDDSVERKLWEGGYSAKAMYGTWAGACLITIVTIVVLALYGRGERAGITWTLAGAAVLIMWAVAIATYLYMRFSYHYELTTQRLIHQNGIFVRRTDRMEVIDIDDVSYTQGIVQRLLGVGRIVVTGSDRTHPELVLDGIDKVTEIASLMDDVRREERRRRSLHIEAI